MPSFNARASIQRETVLVLGLSVELESGLGISIGAVFSQALRYNVAQNL